MSKKNDELVVGTLEDIPNDEFISTGIDEVDEMIGGFGRRRITEIWGNPGVGKSYLLAKTMAKLGGKTLYIDTEFALNKERLVSLGVDLKKIDYLANSQLENVAEFILSNVNKYELIVIDTIAKFTPMTVDTNEVGTSAIGLYARQIAHFDAKLRPRLYASNTALVCVNQVRSDFGMGPATMKPAGAYAWKHTIDMSLRLSKGANNAIYKQTDGVKKQVGHKVTLMTYKNRLGAPQQSCVFDLLY